jgi:tRNA A-37 threonylcarbamoyl transferase component Bud32
MVPERWRKIEQLYLAAVDLSGEERANLLAQASPDVREKVEGMLAQPSGSKLIDLSAWANEPALSGEMESLAVALKPGDKLGPYEVMARIGAGGMGEVYKARDTRLNRIVAIKILPSNLADSAESHDRFEREARMIASLNHPHICTLHDIGHQGTTDYLVMEFLEGETLASRLSKGPLPLEQTLQYAIEIAGALDKAHRKGMTHRDLKPGNIMLTKSGAKLLDFGLAKLKQAASAPGVLQSRLSTAENTITAQGAIVGTLRYMAPEQLEGKETDARTDLFAFGAVIYEMVTDKRAFEGKSQASIIAKILEIDPPPMSSLQPMTPATFERVVRTCLAKDPDHRLQSVQDLKLELEWIRDAVAEPLALAGAAPRAGLASSPALGVIRSDGAGARGVSVAVRGGPAERASARGCAAPNLFASEALLTIERSARALPGCPAIGLFRNECRRHSPRMGSRPELARNPGSAGNGIRGCSAVLVARWALFALRLCGRGNAR